jgi:crossover junction endodeoxyribonuclease RuvC
MNLMRVLGIDPGYSLVGFSIVEEERNSYKLLKVGVVDTSDEKDFEKKLLIIFNTIDELVKEFRPEFLCIEELFFNKNVKTGIKVAQTIGVIKLVALKNNIKIVEITPLEVKKYITGTSGKHPKIQIQNLVRIILNLDDVIKPDDAADSVAIAIAGLGKIFGRSRVEHL